MPVQLDNFYGLHARVIRESQGLCVRVVRLSAGYFAGRVRDKGTLAPGGGGRFQTQTGALVGGTKARFTTDGRGPAAFVTNAIKHARYLEDGTGLYGPKRRAYVIEPREKKALAFRVQTGRLGGMKVITSRVIHPGIRPRRFWWRASVETYRWALVMSRNVERFEQGFA